MIIRDKPSVFKLFFILEGSIIPLVFPQILFIALLSTLVAVAQYNFPIIFPTYTIAPFTLLGVALSLFLGFRNNACYERWWEARKQWGQLIVDSRSLARQVHSFIDSNKEGGELMQKRLVNLTIAFNHALRHHLRKTEPWDDIRKFLEQEDIDYLKKSYNIPDSILRLMGAKLGTCRHKKLLSDFLVQSIDEHITSMTSVQAACERIDNTPLPFAYRLLVQRTSYLYCIILPFGLVASQGFATPLFCAIVAYTFFGLDALSEELEKPFGLSSNDLPLHVMTRSLEISLLELMGETDLPEPIKPKSHLIE